MIFVVVLMYVLGIMTGALGIVLVTLYLGKRAVNRLKDKFEVDSKSDKSVNDRLRRVKDITNEQLDLLSKSDGPQKNAMDGKYKNSLNRTVKDLEEEKSTILRSIIADGYDPEITAMDATGTVVKMKLSEFMLNSDIDMPVKTETKAPKSTQVGKFTIYKGGKDDTGGKTNH